MTRHAFFAALAFLLIGTAPVLAKETLADAPPTSLSTPKTDSPTDAMTDSTQPADPSVAMAAASVSSEALSNFGPSSGTIVGNRAIELRDEILRLRASVNLNSNEFAVLRSSGAAGAVQYHSTVAAITARLQNGTTRGNPILQRQWEEANGSLDEVTSSLGRLNSLQTAIDADASMSSYLMESVQAAFQLSGAVDEDHDQLKLLRDELSRMIVQLDYLRSQTTNDIERQTNYLTTERQNLQALAFAISRGELLGNSFGNRPVIVNSSPFMAVPEAPAPYMAPQPAPRMPVTPGAFEGPAPMPAPMTHETSAAPMPVQSSNGAAAVPTPSIGQLLVLIRYNQPHIQYEQQLSQAIGTAIERRPNAQFSVVAVSPSSGDPADLAAEQASAQRNADAVKRSLVQLGLPPSRITMASTQVQAAQTPEVHVYIR